MSIPVAGRIVIAAVLIGGLAWGGVALARAKDDGSGGGGSGGGAKPTRLGPSSSLIFGDVKDPKIPKDFDPNGKYIKFSPDCSAVLVGSRFWQYKPGTAEAFYQCVEHNTLMAALNDDGNACGFIDYLMNQENITDHVVILGRMLEELRPPCLAAPSESWPPAMKAFSNWLSTLVAEYVGTVTQTDIAPYQIA